MSVGKELNTNPLTIFLLTSRSSMSGLETMDTLTYQSLASGELYFSSTSSGESLSEGGREEEKGEGEGRRVEE